MLSGTSVMTPEMSLDFFIPYKRPLVGFMKNTEGFLGGSDG